MPNRTNVKLDEYPQYIRVGAVDYLLNLSDSFSENLGETEPNTAILRVSNGLPQGKFTVTLLHELFHAIVEEYGILQGTPLATEKDEEAIVTRLATALATTMQNNQVLFFKIVHSLDTSLIAKVEEDKPENPKTTVPKTKKENK